MLQLMKLEKEKKNEISRKESIVRLEVNETGSRVQKR